MNKVLYVSSTLFLLLFGFQNCSLTDSQHIDLSSSLGKACLSSVQAAFKETYYPHLRSNCTSCHDSGGIGIGWFANRDQDAAFSAFLSTTRAKINTMMVYDGHPGPNNGPNQQAWVDSMQSRWTSLDKQIDDCANSGAITTVGKNNSVQDVAITDANDPNKRPWRTLEWDFYTDLANSSLNGKIQMVVRIRYREAQSGGVDIGYEFSRPSARIRNGAATGTQYAVDNLQVLLNGNLLTSVTSFIAIKDVIVSGTTDTVLINSAASPGIVSNKDINTDQISIRFAQIRDANGRPVGADDSSGTGGETSTVPTRVTYAQLIDPNNAIGYLGKYCISCHRAGNPAGSLDLTNYSAASLAASTIKSRINNSSRPMPTGGLLSSYERDVIGRWVDIGAPQN